MQGTENHAWTHGHRPQEGCTDFLFSLTFPLKLLQEKVIFSKFENGTLNFDLDHKLVLITMKDIQRSFS